MVFKDVGSRKSSIRGSPAWFQQPTTCVRTGQGTEQNDPIRPDLKESQGSIPWFGLNCPLRESRTPATRKLGSSPARFPALQ